MSGLRWIQNDGGRAAADYRGKTGDCACRAVAIAAGLPYDRVYADLDLAGKRERNSKKRRGKKSSASSGVFGPTMRRYMASLGWTWVPTMQVGSGCKVHLAEGELPMGRIVALVSRHYVAVLDGVVHDSHDPTRNGRRCVYGYWTAPA